MLLSSNGRPLSLCTRYWLLPLCLWNISILIRFFLVNLIYNQHFMIHRSHWWNVFMFIWFCPITQQLTETSCHFVFMNMSENLLFPLLTLPAVAIPSPSPECSFFLLHLQAPSFVPCWADQKMPACTQRCTSSSPPCALTWVWTLLTAPRRPQRRREAKCQSRGEWKVTSLAFFLHYFSARLFVVF